MYPVWEVPYLTSGLIVALIATFHILPSHLSVAAMWFNVFTETKTYRQNRPELLEFNRKFSKMILIFAYVFGSLSGIGIWYAITVGNPRGTSALIHSYVWAWAAEWVFFLIEISAIFIYYYTFDKVDKKTHLRIGWIFALASWPTMIIITGIISFMATSNDWPATGSFFRGLYNPSFWPQLAMRTVLMFAVGAAYAVAVAALLKNEEAKKFVVRTASLWGLGGLILGAIFLPWYLHSLPQHSQEVIAVIMPPGLNTAMILAFGFLILYFLFLRFRPSNIGLFPALLAILILFVGIWSTERTREILRKPYVIPGYIYSNQIIGHDLPARGINSEIEVINRDGILKVSPFIPTALRSAETLPSGFDAGKLVEAGRLIALIECSACHTLNDRGLRPLPQMARRMALDDEDMAAGLLEILGESYSYMPPHAGTESERSALAAYLVSLNQPEDQ